MTYSCAVASPHVLATEAAEAAVRRGGNAIDAALAAAATLTVVYPHNTALGGDLIALVRTPDGAIMCVNASGPAPRAASREAVAERHGGAMPVTGPDTITVPGMIAGWAALRDYGAALPWAAQFEAAIEHAASTPVVPGLAHAIAESADLIDADPGLRAVFGGLRAGDPLRQPALRRTLTRLAADGPMEFYRGELGARLVAGLDSPVTTADLAAYAVERCAPLSRPYRGLDVHTSPPNSQGLLLLQALLAEVAEPLGAGAGRLTEAFVRGIADRERHLADPRFAAVDVESLLDPARPTTAGLPTGTPSGDTVAIVTADTEGYAVSLIQSLFHGFGSGILEPETGILLHNRGSFFSLDLASPNVLAPGKRPAHTLMPVLVTAQGRPAYVTGVMGGKAQPQINAQVLMRLLDGATPAEAVAAPRFIVGGLDRDDPTHVLLVEPGLDPAAATALAATRLRQVTLPEGSGSAGHAQAIRVGEVLEAGSDPRSDGRAAVVTR